MPHVVRVGTVRQFLGSPGVVLYQVGLFGEDGTEVGLVYDGKCRCCAGQSCLHSRTVERLREQSGALEPDDELGEQLVLELAVDQRSHGSRETRTRSAPSVGGTGPRRSLRSVMVRATVVPGTSQWRACSLHALRTRSHVLYMPTAVSSVVAEGRCSWDSCSTRLLMFLRHIPGATRSGYGGVQYTLARAELGVSNMNAGCNNWRDTHLSVHMVRILSAQHEGFLCSVACTHPGALGYVQRVGPLQGSLLCDAVALAYPGRGVDVIISRGMSYTPPHQDSHATILVLASLSSTDAIMRVAVRGNVATDLSDVRAHWRVAHNPFRCCVRRRGAICPQCRCWEVFELHAHGSCITLPAGVVHAVESHGFRVAISYWI